MANGNLNPGKAVAIGDGWQEAPPIETKRHSDHSALRQIAGYLGPRLLQAVFVLFGALLISFLLTTLSGNSAALRSGGGLLSPQQLEEISAEQGFDKPVLERFGHYVEHAVQGDLGSSYRTGTSALEIVLEAVPYTLILVAGALLLSLAVGLVVAIVSVVRRGRTWDLVVRRTFLLGQGFPEFWLAILLVLIFSVWLRWLPSVGYSGLESAILPILALSIPLIPALIRLLQGQMLDVMSSEFIVAARAKGLSERAVVLRHSLRNALPGFVTYLALQIGWLIAGTIIVEAVFQWPGVGQVALSAVKARDVAVIQAVVMVIAVIYVCLNLVADLLVIALDPRIRTRGQ